MSTTQYDSAPDTRRHIARVRGLLMQAVSEFYSRAAKHDATKLEEPEKALYDEYTPKLEAMDYSTDPDSEYMQTLAGMGPALAHHYEHNRHHPEYHKDGIRGMNLVDMLEMLADWKAAGERHGGDLASSIAKNASRFGYGDETYTLLLNTARDLGWL